MPCTRGCINITVIAFFGGCVLIAEVPKNQKALVGMNSTLPSALVHRPPKVITPTSRYAPRDDWCFAASKNVGADSISARARLRQDKPPRAHIECAPTDLVFNIGLAGSGRYNKKRVCDILDVTDSWCAVQDSNL